MKKLFMIIIVIMGLFAITGCYKVGSRATAEAIQEQNAVTATNTVEVPTVSYFQERRTIAKWTSRWDKANVVTYVYLVSYGTILGYYVADGKPASTRSYLIPEEKIEGYPSAPVVVSTQDIDGTYGDNNEGIRFFTAEGTAVEWGGSGATYIYSDAPLPINVPKFNVVVSTATPNPR